MAAATKGNHGGRPKVIDDDMLLFARALKDKGVPVPEIAKKLTIKTGKNTGQHPSANGCSVVPRGRICASSPSDGPRRHDPGGTDHRNLVGHRPCRGPRTAPSPTADGLRHGPPHGVHRRPRRGRWPRVLALDVTDEESMRAAVEAVEADHGPVGVLVDEAGYGEFGTVEETDPDDVRRRQSSPTSWGSRA